MMSKRIILTTWLLLTLTTAFAQIRYRNFYPASKIHPYRLETGFYKTTVLIFPAPINKNGIDRGSADIIAKTVPGVSNILKLKANKKGFPETNLTVVTTDGKVYPFVINYSDNPPDAPINMGKQLKKEASLADFRNRKLNSEQVAALAKSIVKRKAFMHKKTKSFKIKLTLSGIYACKDVLFFRFVIKNKSRIDYSIRSDRFYIRNKKRVKRTARQEKEIKPLLVYTDGHYPISGKNSRVIVIAFKKFTIVDHKELVIQIFEKNGDRNLNLHINGNTLSKTQFIPVIL